MGLRCVTTSGTAI